MCRRLRKTFLEIVVFKMGLKKERGFYQVEMEDEGYLSFHMYSLCLSHTHMHTHKHTHILISFHTSSTNNYSNPDLYHMTKESYTLKKEEEEEEKGGGRG